jgi:hypothetical protein
MFLGYIHKNGTDILNILGLNIGTSEKNDSACVKGTRFTLLNCLVDWWELIDYPYLTMTEYITPFGNVNQRVKLTVA